MAQNLPSKIGKYEVLEILGQGGMGTVYKAIDPRIGRLVAIKVIVADGIDDPELLKRFYREAKAVGNLQHPNIVIVYDLGEENKNPYLVMEYLDGEPLNKIIASHREVPLLQKLSIVAKVCDALSFAHQRDIVHRDVKPANVMLLKDGQVKLLDFGIARLGNTGYNQTETRKGQVMGTMNYMSPEQLNEEIVDGRSDVYSTGVVLFELLTYRLPFEASDLGSLIAKKMQGNPPPPLSRYIENYPPELDEILVRALAKDREERHGSAQDLAFDLERLIERLRRDMVSQYVERARDCISIAALSQAKDLLSEVLRIDTQHTAAKQLLYEVQQSIQKQKRLEHIRQLQQHSREALAQKQFDDASRFAEEAIKLDDTDPDSLNLRESIQQSKLRAQQIKKLLHLAEVAQQSGELGVLQKAVSDALNLDPDDPQALVFQASLIRLQAEQEKEAKVREWLTAARRDLAAHHFDAAQENVLKAEALDPHWEDIPALKQMVAAGRQQETRARQQQEFCRDIQQELDGNNPVSAKELAEKALRVFPGEPLLLRLKSAAESQIEAEQRRKYIAEQIASASKLLELGDPSRALTIAEQANRQFPTDTRLRDFLHVVRQSVQEDVLKRGQQAVLTQAREEMRQKRFAEAVKILEAGQIKYPEFTDISEQLPVARNEHQRQKDLIAEISQQAQMLLAKNSFGDAVSLLEKTVVETPDLALQNILQNARVRAAEFNKDLELLRKEATALLESGRSVEAVAKLQSRAGTLGQSPIFEELLERAQAQVAGEQELKRQIRPMLDEGRQHLRRGSIREAEAVLAECRSKAPMDASVVAFSTQLLEAKAVIEREHEIKQAAIEKERARSTIHVDDVTPPEAKANAASATSLFQPSAAVADITPPAGHTILSQDADLDVLPTPASEVLSPASEASISTRRFTLPIEIQPPPSVPADEESATSPSTQEAAITAEPPVLPPKADGIGVSRSKLVGIGALLAVGLIAVGVYRQLHKSQTSAAPVSVTIQTSPAGATVHAGESTCTAPCTLNLKPGSYEITADLKGFSSVKQRVDIHANRPTTLVLPELAKVTLPQSPVAPSPAPVGVPADGKSNVTTPIPSDVREQPLEKGTLEIHAGIDGASVVIDDRRAGMTDAKGSYRTQLDVGQHTVRVQKDKYQSPRTQTVTVAKNHPTRATFTLIPPTSVAAVSASAATNTAALPPPPLRATLVVHGPAGAAVRIDDRSEIGVPSSGSLEVPVDAGEHSVVVTLEGHKSWSQRQTFVAGSRVDVVPDLPKLVAPPPTIPAAAAPPPPPSTEPTGSATAAAKGDDERRIRDALSQYVQAMQEKDEVSVRRVWPAMTDKDYRRLTAAFNNADSIQISLDGCKQDSLDGAVAHVSCQQTSKVKARGTVHPLSNTAVFTLRKLRTGDWIIDKASVN